MLRRDARFGTLNDGVVDIYIRTSARDAQGIDPASLIGLVKVAGMAFESLSCRQQDLELAEGEGRELTRKIRTRDYSAITSDTFAAIDGKLYEVFYVDRSARSAYLYLESIETDGQVVLVSSVEGTDDVGRPKGDEVTSTVWCRKRVLSQTRDVQVTDILAPTIACTMRTVDWGGQPVIRRDGKDHTTIKAETRGEWTTVTATRKAGDDT